MQLRLQYPPTPEAAPRHAALCVAAARTLQGVELDYSVESLRRLDALIESLRQGGMTIERMAEVLFAFGCYVGEIFVRNAGGGWCRTEGTLMDGVAGFPLIIQLAPQRYCNPVGKVFKRLEVGSEHALPRFYTRFAPAEAGQGLMDSLH